MIFSTDHVWQLRKDKRGKYVQINNPKTSLCVDVAGGAMTRNGLNIQQRHCEAADKPRTTHWWYMKEVTCNKATPLNKPSTRSVDFASSNLVLRSVLNAELRKTLSGDALRRARKDRARRRAKRWRAWKREKKHRAKIRAKIRARKRARNRARNKARKCTCK